MWRKSDPAHLVPGRHQQIYRHCLDSPDPILRLSRPFSFLEPPQLASVDYPARNSMLPRALWLAVTCSCHGVGRGGAASIYKAHPIEAAVFVQIIHLFVWNLLAPAMVCERRVCVGCAPPTPQRSPCVPSSGESPGPRKKTLGLSSVKKPSVPRNTAPTTRPCHSCRKFQVTWNAGALSLVVELHDNSRFWRSIGMSNFSIASR